jgi:hypothetical protein
MAETSPAPKNPPRPKPYGKEQTVFDQGQPHDPEDADDHEFDEMRQDEGALDKDDTLNDGSSAMSDQPSNGPGNKFGSKFNE